MGTAEGCIRVGIGGWTYPPWRGTFYPPGLPQARELDHAVSHVTAIEINATFYGRQKPASFARWAKAAPDGFQFSVKASRFCTNRRLLGEAGEAVERFFAQGVEELGDRLGPILWQFAPTKQFDPYEFAAFLQLLPATVGGLKLRHALEVRHRSFCDSAFVALARAAGAAIVFADSDDYPCIADLSGNFVYARLQRAREEMPDGYDEQEIGHWAELARQWARGEAPAELDHMSAEPAPAEPRDVYLFMINGAKLRAPAAAQALLGRLAAR
jgi:uncharacterized protein YecE (DUF72 family)